MPVQDAQAFALQGQAVLREGLHGSVVGQRNDALGGGDEEGGGGIVEQCLPKVCFLLAGGDVGLGADDQPGNFCVVRRNLPSDFHPPPCALLGEQACFHVEGLAQGNLALQRGEHPVAVIRVHMLLPRLKVQLLRKHFVAQHLVAALVHLDDAGAGVPFPQAVLHGRHGQAQPRFAAAQCFHHGVLFSHVVDVPVPQRGPIGFALRLGLAGQPPDLAVGQHLAPFVAPQFQRAG